MAVLSIIRNRIYNSDGDKKKIERARIDTTMVEYKCF